MSIKRVNKHQINKTQ